VVRRGRKPIQQSIVLLPGLEAVRSSKADRSCRREGQKATLDDLEHQDQVGLPAAEVGCCLEYLLDDRNRHGQCRCEEEATGHSNTVPLEIEDSYGYHHGVGPPYEKDEIRNRSDRPDEKMNGPEPSPYNGSSGSKKAIKPAQRARRAISRCGFVLGVVCMSRMLLRSEAVGKAAETVRADQLPSSGHDSYRRLLGAKRDIARVCDGGNQLEESTAASHSPIHRGRSERRPS
jgi:hypothetical protein